ncbi:MAG: DUF1003 domain-containing protein [Patescibacteria group bacterium]|nr:DUF1003 domain-containing protein [Patescibacteria group bacterium]
MARNINKEHQDNLKAHERLILWIATGVGSTLFLVFCILLSFTPLAFPNTLEVVQFISSGFLQLVLLPIIVISGNNQQKHAELRAENDYEINLKAEKDIEEILSILKGRKD